MLPIKALLVVCPFPLKDPLPRTLILYPFPFLCPLPFFVPNPLLTGVMKILKSGHCLRHKCLLPLNRFLEQRPLLQALPHKKNPLKTYAVPALQPSQPAGIEPSSRACHYDGTKPTTPLCSFVSACESSAGGSSIRKSYSSRHAAEA